MHLIPGKFLAFMKCKNAKIFKQKMKTFASKKSVFNLDNSENLPAKKFFSELFISRNSIIYIFFFLSRHLLEYKSIHDEKFRNRTKWKYYLSPHSTPNQFSRNKSGTGEKLSAKMHLVTNFL